MVNATVGEFEAGFEAGGQTREHAVLVRSLGVKQLAVAINKMDTVRYLETTCTKMKYCQKIAFKVGWSEVRFSEIVQKLKTFLKQAGFKVCGCCYNYSCCYY